MLLCINLLVFTLSLGYFFNKRILLFSKDALKVNKKVIVKTLSLFENVYISINAVILNISLSINLFVFIFPH